MHLLRVSPGSLVRADCPSRSLLHRGVMKLFLASAAALLAVSTSFSAAQAMNCVAYVKSVADWDLSGNAWAWWDGAEPIGCNHLYHMTHGAQLPDNRGQRAYHTVHLWQPRVGDDHDPVRGCWRQHLIAADQLVKDEMVRQWRAAAFGAARRTTVGWPSPNRSAQADHRDVPPGRCSSPPSRRR